MFYEVETKHISIPCHIFPKSRVSPQHVREVPCQTIYEIAGAVTDAAETFTYMENRLHLMTFLNKNKTTKINPIIYFEDLPGISTITFINLKIINVIYKLNKTYKAKNSTLSYYEILLENVGNLGNAEN